MAELEFEGNLITELWFLNLLSLNSSCWIQAISEVLELSCESESEVAQSCLTLCDPMDCSPPGSSIYGIFQTRILEWIATLFSGDLPNPGIESGSPALQADSLPSEPPGDPHTTRGHINCHIHLIRNLLVFINVHKYQR